VSFSLALRALLERPLSTILTALSVALGVALVIAVLLLEREAQGAYRRTAVGVEVLVAGNKGSRIDALLSTLYHVGRAPGRVSWSYYEKIKRDPRVAYAVPLAVGDRYLGRPVVGTTAELFGRFRPRPGVGFDIEGRVFDKPHEAVAGARSGLSVGDTFHAGHGKVIHDEITFAVVGVARATGTAHDKVLWIPIRSFLKLEGHVGLQRGKQEFDAVSAVLVKTTSGSPFLVEPLIREINDGSEAQAIRPVQVVGELFSLVADAQQVLSWIGVLVVGVAGLAVMVALYNTMAARRREIAILRALGATRRHVFFSVLLEAAMICGLGALLGMALGHGGAALATPFLEARTGIRLDTAAGLLAAEPAVVAAIIAMGCAAGVIPALTAYRTDVARGLS